MHKLSRRTAVCGLVGLVAGSTFPITSRSVAEEVPLAIKGFDPVAYFTMRNPTRGLSELEYEWDEQRYRFSRPEHRELFKADPVRYAPQFGNSCAMALTRGEVDEANPEYWLISDDRLYIFGKAIGPNVFQQALTENVMKANQNRPLILKR